MYGCGKAHCPKLCGLRFSSSLSCVENVSYVCGGLLLCPKCPVHKDTVPV